jgi:DNA (cytosine-5)-methyltransferase 1
MQIIHYDLFAGIGGFSYALDKTYEKEKIKHIFVEIDPFCQAVLKKHWQEGEFWGDIRDFIANAKRKGLEGNKHQERQIARQNTTINTKNDKKIPKNNSNTPHRDGSSRGYGEGCYNQENNQGQTGGNRWSDENSSRITVLTGGFPCQPFSQAGRRKGTADDRYLWGEMFEAIRIIKPDWVVAENVRGLITIQNGLVFEGILSDLESEGYAVQTFIIPACAVGAPHRRDRVWIVAHSTGKRCDNWADNRQERPVLSDENRNAEKDKSTGEKWKRGVGEVDSNASYTTSRQSWKQTKQEGWEDIGGGDKNVKNSISQRSGRRMEGGRQILECQISEVENERPSWESHWIEVASTLCNVDDGICRKLDRAVEWLYEKDNYKMGSKKGKSKADFVRWQMLRALWEYGASSEAPLNLHDFGLYDSLPEVPHQARPGRWLAQEETTKKVRDLWERFYSKSFKKAQNLQQELLEYLREIERTKTVAIKKDNKGVWSVWKKVHLPQGKANDVFKELCSKEGVDKKEIKIYSRSAWRTQALKAGGNAIVPQIAIEIFKSILQAENKYGHYLKK